MIKLLSLLTLLLFYKAIVGATHTADLSRKSFPKGFLFGTATSAYQVEGMASKGGRGPSIWDEFIKTPGLEPNNATGEVTVDQYHRYKEDIDLMVNLNFDAYRFSISWTRIFPNGTGKVNRQGVAYYNRLINYMLRKGITPYANLNHYDLPLALENRYLGWLSRDVVKDYADYAEFCFKTFGDRVKNWMTFNEPRVVAALGYDNGFFAPGRCSKAYGNCTAGNSATEPYIVTHNLILSHAAAVQRYRQKYQEKQKGRIGILLDFVWYEPLTRSKADNYAAQRARDFHVGWFLHPLVYGEYPKTMQNIVKDRLPKFTKEEVKPQSKSRVTKMEPMIPNGNTQPSSTTKLTESLKLEHQLVRVPFEEYKKTIRSNHRHIEKEVTAVISGLLPDSQNDAVKHLNSLVSRLQGLKRKLEDGNRVEQMQAQRCRARLEHLESADGDNIAEWSNTRLNRILVDYMLRMSYYDTAKILAERSNIQELVDIEIFYEAKKVIDALQNKEVAPALAWCAENKSRLKKSKSKFEFQLRLQEFIELGRGADKLLAVKYARKHLVPWAATYMKEFQKVFVTLVFKSDTGLEKYKVLYEPKQWDFLIDQFKQEFCKLYGMTLEPLLNIYLQAGLSALKTPFCYEDDCTKEDPLSQENFRKLANPLPFSKQHHSKLVCYITKELMDTENPPLVLPNGYVYSEKALLEMANKNDGRITCPRTGYVCTREQLTKAFIS